MKKRFYVMTFLVIILALACYFLFPELISAPITTPANTPPEKITVAKETSCEKCHVKFTNLKTKFKFMHRPVALGNCGDCHILPKNGSKEHGALINNLDAVCTNCHTKLLVNGMVGSTHRPFKEGKCLSCHDPHASNEKGLLKTNAAALCTTCHTINKGRVSHRPYQKKDCLSCHVPHASNVNGLLKTNASALCTACHTLNLGRVSHRPYQKRECLSCHVPHASGNTGLTRLPGSKLCMSCHSKDLNASLPSKHAPVVNGKCSDCHVPHTGPNVSILKKTPTTLCAGCHSTIAKRFAVSKHKKVGNCLACHEAHYSRNQPLLIKPSNLLCLGCHPNSIRLASHPPGKKFIHPSSRTVSCTKCHDPHGSYWVSDENLCVICHSR